MDILLLILLLTIGLPITVVIHETGHALALLCVTKKGIARIYLGDFNNSNKENFRFGRIHYHIVWGYSGLCRYSNLPDDLTRGKKAMISLGGPLISAASAIILFLLSHYQPFPTYVNFFITGMFWMNVLQFLGTIIPIVYPKWWVPYAGYPSDGYQVWKALKR